MQNKKLQITLHVHQYATAIICLQGYYGTNVTRALCVGEDHIVLPNDTVKILDHLNNTLHDKIATAMCTPEEPQLSNRSILVCVHDALDLPESTKVNQTADRACKSTSELTINDCTKPESALVEAKCGSVIPESEAVICSGNFWQNDSVTLDEELVRDPILSESYGHVLCQGPSQYALGCWSKLYGKDKASSELTFPPCLDQPNAYCTSEQFLQYVQCTLLQRQKNVQNQSAPFPPPLPPEASPERARDPYGPPVPGEDEDDRSSLNVLCSGDISIGKTVTIEGSRRDSQEGTAVCGPSDKQVIVCWGDTGTTAWLSLKKSECIKRNVRGCRNGRLQRRSCRVLTPLNSTSSDDGAPSTPGDNGNAGNRSNPGAPDLGGGPSDGSPRRGEMGSPDDGAGGKGNTTDQATESTSTNATKLLDANKQNLIGATVAIACGTAAAGMLWRWWSTRAQREVTGGRAKSSVDEGSTDLEDDDAESGRGSESTTRV